LAVAGDSAGGTLAASAALMARDAGLPLRLQAMFYPSVQARLRTDSFKAFSQGLVLDEPMMRWFESLAMPAESAAQWQREPLYAPSHAGLAPAWIGIAECDPLADDGRLYAEALKQAGVPTQLVEFSGTVHDFINMGRFLPQAAQAHTALALVLKAALTAASPAASPTA
jgi:acetyl esterase